MRENGKKSLLSDNVNSYKNQKISEENLRIYSISKRHSGLIELRTEKLKCYIKAKFRPHGNFEDHRGGLDIPSLNINLKEGNIKGITKFLLLRPETRNYNNEIFNSVLFRKFGFLSPVTFNSNLIYNNKTYRIIFQEKIVKEFLENSNLRESFITELDERFLWFDSVDSINYSKFGVSNHKLILKSNKNYKIAEYAISLLNDLERINVRLDQDYTDYSTLSKILNKNYFVGLDTFEALIYSLIAEHGLQKDERKFYFDPFKRNFIPIYYDGMGNLLNEKGNLSDKQINDIPKFLPSAKNGSTSALLILQNIDLKNLKKDLEKMKLIISENELEEILKKIEFNLNFLKSLDNERLYKISINKKKEVIDQNSLFNPKLKRKFVYYKKNFSGYLQCEFYKKNCKNFDLSEKDKSELLRQNLSHDDVNFVFTGSTLNSLKSKNFYYHFLNEIDERNFTILNLENNIKIFHNNKVNIEIDRNKKEIHIENFDDEKVVFFESDLKNWKINFSRNLLNNKDKLINNTNRTDEFGLTGCLSFIDTKIYDLNLKIENMNCEDSVNFIRTKGIVKKIEINNAKFDGIDADFSELIFENINVSSSLNDCLDFSYGKYKVKKAKLNVCGDKSISAGERSLLDVNNLEIFNSQIGVASKDSSKVIIDNANITQVNHCLTAYKKKQEFWGGYILGKNIYCEEYDQFKNVDTYSKIEITSKNL